MLRASTEGGGDGRCDAEMDGLAATRQIMSCCPTPIIVVTAYGQDMDMDIAFEALKSGAMDALAKLSSAADREAWEIELRERVRALAAVQIG